MKSDDRGDTLLELLVAVTVMGIAVVALVGGIATSIKMSDLHRQQAATGAYVRSYAEAIEAAVAESPTGYVPCAGTGAYQSLYSPGGGYTGQVTAVAYWSGSAFTSTCTPSADSGVQRVSLQVSSPDGTTVETLTIVVRNPCRSTEDYPLDAPCT